MFSAHPRMYASGLDNRTAWGHIDHTRPVGVDEDLRRTSYRACHRPIPPNRNGRKCHRPFTSDCHRFDTKLTYRTTSACYGKSKPTCATTYERAPLSVGVHFMAHVGEKMSRSRGYGRQPTTEFKANYRGNESIEPPVDPPTAPRVGGGFNASLGHYATTSRMHHRLFTDERPMSCRSTKNEPVTFWSGLDYPKVIGLNASCREIVMPLNSEIKHAAWRHDRFFIRQMDKTLPRTIAWLNEGYISETKKSYVPPQKGFIKCK